MKDSLLFLVFLFMSIGLLYSDCGDIIYVDAAASGLNDGSSWDDAFVNLQDGLDQAYNCTEMQEVWVAGGRYVPTVDIQGGPSDNLPQNKTFYIKENILLYGGFGGFESDVNQRIKYLYSSILSGDQFNNDFVSVGATTLMNITDNSYNIMRMKNLNETTIIDGFLFSGGNAVHSNTFSKQTGGAIFNDGRGTDLESSPIISNCSFYYCHSQEGGGAIYNYGVACNVSPTFLNCEFKYNSSDGDGGAVSTLANAYQVYSLLFENCVFAFNEADGDGGAILFELMDMSINGMEFMGCSFVGNKGSTGGGIMIVGGFEEDSTMILNTVFHLNEASTVGGNSDFESTQIPYSIKYSHFDMADGSNFNSSGDPLFLSSTNFRLQASSPLINTGKPPGPPVLGGESSVILDVDANARVMGGRQDIGALEFLSCPTSNTIYVNDDQTENSPTGGSIDFALKSLNAALVMACHCSQKPTVLVSEGSYIPHRLDSMVVPYYRSFYARRFSTYTLSCPINLYGGRANSILDSQSELSVLEGDILQNDMGNDLTNKNDNIVRLMNMNHLASGSNIEGFLYRNAFDNFDHSFDQVTSCTALEIDVSTQSAFSLLVAGCEFRDNFTYGGVTICVNSNSDEANINFENCMMQGNGANRGSAINYVGSEGSNCQLKVLNCTIQGNNALASYAEAYGPFNYFTNSSGNEGLYISNCDFVENSNSDFGGAVSIILDGDGDYVVDINECEFNDNDAHFDGGAIYFSTRHAQEFNIRNSYFTVNNSLDGGACFFTSTDPFEVKIVNSIFHRNRSESQSGGDNNGGGAILNLRGASIHVSSCTFYKNSTHLNGGAILSNGSAINNTINNTLFWENTRSSNIVNSIRNTDQSETALNYSLLDEPDCSMFGVACSNSIFGQDPLLDLNIGTRRFSPMLGSPAINSGDNSVSDVPYNFIGSRYNPNIGPSYRILGNTIDIGAFEYQGMCLKTLIIDPLDITFLNDELAGAWRASQSIIVKPGFSTPTLDWLILDAPEVIIEGSYDFLSMKSLEISAQGCNPMGL